MPASTLLVVGLHPSRHLMIGSSLCPVVADAVRAGKRAAAWPVSRGHRTSLGVRWGTGALSGHAGPGGAGVSQAPTRSSRRAGLLLVEPERRLMSRGCLHPSRLKATKWPSRRAPGRAGRAAAA